MISKRKIIWFTLIFIFIILLIIFFLLLSEPFKKYFVYEKSDNKE